MLMEWSRGMELQRAALSEDVALRQDVDAMKLYEVLS